MSEHQRSHSSRPSLGLSQDDSILPVRIPFTNTSNNNVTISTDQYKTRQIEAFSRKAVAVTSHLMGPLEGSSGSISHHYQNALGEIHLSCGFIGA